MNPRKKYKYRQVVKLRFQGKSYREISKKLEVAKGTVSQWCKHLKLPLHIQEILKEKGTATGKNLAEYNKRRSIAIRAENRKIERSALWEIWTLSKHELLLVGAALYWAEGYKVEKQKYPEISFSNSDPTMIALFLRFLRELMKIPDEDLRLTIRIYSGMKKDSIIRFWSKLTNIPTENFKVSYQVSRASQGKRPYNVLPFGTIRLQLRGRRNAFRIKGWINGLKKQSGFKE